MPTSFTSLGKDADKRTVWGLASTQELNPGDRVEVSRRDGQNRMVRVGERVPITRDAGNGAALYLYEIAGREQQRTARLSSGTTVTKGPRDHLRSWLPPRKQDAPTPPARWDHVPMAVGRAGDSSRDTTVQPPSALQAPAPGTNEAASVANPRVPVAMLSPSVTAHLRECWMEMNSKRQGLAAPAQDHPPAGVTIRPSATTGPAGLHGSNGHEVEAMDVTKWSASQHVYLNDDVLRDAVKAMPPKDRTQYALSVEQQGQRHALVVFERLHDGFEAHKPQRAAEVAIPADDMQKAQQHYDHMVRIEHTQRLMAQVSGKDAGMAPDEPAKPRKPSRERPTKEGLLAGLKSGFRSGFSSRERGADMGR